MRFLNKLLLLTLLLSLPGYFLAQRSDFFHVDHIETSGFQLSWDTNEIKPSRLILKNTHTNNSHSFQVRENQNSLVFSEGKPANIYKLEVERMNNSITDMGYYVTKSLSSGEIKVYFNHTVDTSVATTQYAVNLGDKMDDTLIAYINRVQSTLDIAIYNSYSPSSSAGIAGAINAAHARGVIVRVIHDGSTSSSMISLLHPDIPTLASPTDWMNYGIMHNKFVIMDANSTNPLKPIVWTGSTNWTEVQIDGPDKNNTIIIQDQSLALAYKIEFEEMWGGPGNSPTSDSKFGKYKTNNTPHNFNIGGTFIECFFSPTDGVNNKIIANIQNAYNNINIAAMVITRDDIAYSLINKHTSSFPSINVLMDTQNPLGNEFPLLSANLAVNSVQKYTGTGIMHHKFMIVDHDVAFSDPLVLTGSHNWSSSAEFNNDENTLIVHDFSITNQYYQAFYELFTEAGGVIEVGLEEVAMNENISLYPNPVADKLNIRFKKPMPESSMQIFNELGAQVFQQTMNFEDFIHIDASNLKNGLYFMIIEEGNKSTRTKFVIAR